MTGARMQDSLENLRISIERRSGFIKDAGAKAVAEYVIGISSNSLKSD